MLASVGTWLQHFRGPSIYLVCGLLVFGETALLLGFVLPGEIAAVAGGALAALGHANVGVMVVVVVVCATVGSVVGYEVGRAMGPLLLRRRPLRDRESVRKAQDLLVRHGPSAVLLGRWMAFGRPLVPGLTGMSGMRYRTFLVYNALGCLLWGTVVVLLGYVAGRSWQAVAARAGTYAFVALGGLVALGVVVVLVRRRKSRIGRVDPDAGRF